jgi:hypothetical protein
MGRLLGHFSVMWLVMYGHIVWKQILTWDGRDIPGC